MIGGCMRIVLWDVEEDTTVTRVFQVWKANLRGSSRRKKQGDPPERDQGSDGDIRYLVLGPWMRRTPRRDIGLYDNSAAQILGLLCLLCHISPKLFPLTIIKQGGSEQDLARTGQESSKDFKATSFWHQHLCSLWTR